MEIDYIIGGGGFLAEPNRILAKIRQCRDKNQPVRCFRAASCVRLPSGCTPPLPPPPFEDGGPSRCGAQHAWSLTCDSDFRQREDAVRLALPCADAAGHADHQFFPCAEIIHRENSHTWVSFAIFRSRGTKVKPLCK